MSGFRLVVAVILAVFLPSTAFAQSARATGTVRDTNGRPIKGATVRASNRDARPAQITSTTDDKGRWAMIGLRTGTWTFNVEAPGFVAVEAPAPVRVAGTPPMAFTLARDPGPIPGALDKNVMQLVTAANTLRDRGQFDQALTAYQQIREQNPKLTAVSFVMASVYRQQAASATDPTARRALLDRAINAYTPLLEDEMTSARAKLEIETTRAELKALPQ
ncbi:MAG TPA: carboxypeptidase-like regulatory domain-containing protein [Vicinamibacterales bacterium]|nr:carboxypeptidase-like regulatory domain-containing protein [Vicinamibacterales bacterium]